MELSPAKQLFYNNYIKARKLERHPMRDDKGNSNLEQKEKHYANLVKRRKKCYKCKDKGMINPSRHELAKYDEVHAARDHINPWSRARVSLYARAHPQKTF